MEKVPERTSVGSEYNAGVSKLFKIRSVVGATEVAGKVFRKKKEGNVWWT